MAIIIIGTRNRTVVDGGATSKTVSCHSCGQLATYEPVRMRQYFTLFFIPLFPVNKGKLAFRCQNCKTLFQRQAGV